MIVVKFDCFDVFDDFIGTMQKNSNKIAIKSRISKGLLSKKKLLSASNIRQYYSGQSGERRLFTKKVPATEYMRFWRLLRRFIVISYK